MISQTENFSIASFMLTALEQLYLEGQSKIIKSNSNTKDLCSNEDNIFSKMINIFNQRKKNSKTYLNTKNNTIDLDNFTNLSDQIDSKIPLYDDRSFRIQGSSYSNTSDNHNNQISHISKNSRISLTNLNSNNVSKKNKLKNKDMTSLILGLQKQIRHIRNENSSDTDDLLFNSNKAIKRNQLKSNLDEESTGNYYFSNVNIMTENKFDPSISKIIDSQYIFDENNSDSMSRNLSNSFLHKIPKETYSNKSLNTHNILSPEYLTALDEMSSENYVDSTNNTKLVDNTSNESLIVKTIFENDSPEHNFEVKRKARNESLSSLHRSKRKRSIQTKKNNCTSNSITRVKYSVIFNTIPNSILSSHSNDETPEQTSIVKQEEKNLFTEYETSSDIDTHIPFNTEAFSNTTCRSDDYLKSTYSCVPPYRFINSNQDLDRINIELDLPIKSQQNIFHITQEAETQAKRVSKRASIEKYIIENDSDSYNDYNDCSVLHQSKSEKNLLARSFDKLENIRYGAALKAMYSICTSKTDDIKSKLSKIGNSTPDSYNRIKLGEYIRFLTLTISVIFLTYNVDTTKLYHTLRAQSFFKQYVLYNMLEIFERLCRSLAPDILDATIKNWGDRWTLLRVIIMTVYCNIHALMHISRILLLTITICGNNFSTLVLLLVTNNFAEIKSTVFKKFDSRSLFTIVCSDIVERFYLLLDIVMSTYIIRIDGGLPMHWPTILQWAAALITLEVLTDWIKYFFIVQTCKISVVTFDLHRRVLLRDVVATRLPSVAHTTSTEEHDTTSIRYKFYHASMVPVRRLGFSPLPLCVVVIKQLTGPLRHSFGTSIFHIYCNIMTSQLIRKKLFYTLQVSLIFILLTLTLKAIVSLLCAYQSLSRISEIRGIPPEFHKLDRY